MIDVEVELTANHRGHFQLKICPVGRGETEATQAIRQCHRDFGIIIWNICSYEPRFKHLHLPPPPKKKYID